MATIDFSESNGQFKAEFTANADYALHIEREKQGKLRIQQRSSDTGEYADCLLPTWLADGARVVDATLSHGVYPIHIRVISETKVLKAERKEGQ